MNNDGVNEYNSYTSAEAITVTVLPYINNLAGVTQTDVGYGTTIAPQVSYNGTANGGTVEFTYKGRGLTNYPESTEKPTYVGDYTVTATSRETSTVAEAVFTDDFSITAVAQTPTITQVANVQMGNSIDLSTLVKGEQGTVSFTKTSGEGSLTGTNFTPNASGTATFTVNVSEKDMNNDGVNEYNSYTSADAITVTVTAVPTTVVTGIVNVPNSVEVNTDLNLYGEVQPSNATNKNIEWSISTANELAGASITNGVFISTSAGTAKVTATIKDGIALGTDYTQDFEIEVLYAKPAITTGVNLSVVQGQSAIFISSGEFSGYTQTEIIIDGVSKIIHTVGNDNANASATNGSIVLTLSGEYTKSLPVGTHAIAILSAGGVATTNFTVTAESVSPTPTPTPETDEPETGDGSNIALLFVIAFVSIFGLTTVLVIKKGDLT